jgi:hypothetical protein
MEYYLNRINLALMALIGAACVWQWSGERQADSLIESLRQAVAVDERHIAAQAEALRSADADLAEFKTVIVSFKAKSDASDVQIRQQRARLFILERDAKQHAAESAVWTKTLAAYKAAVTDRDGNVRLLLDQRQHLIAANQEAAAKTNQAVVAYNDLAAKYTDLVGHYEVLAKRYRAEHPPAVDGATRPAS